MLRSDRHSLDRSESGADSSEHSLEGLELPFRRLLETLPTAAYVCDKEGLIRYFNPQAARLWGREPALNCPSDRYCGSFKLFDPQGAPITHDTCWMALALRDRRPYEGREILIEQPGGQRVPVLAYANPVWDENEKLLGAVNVLVDISERVRLEARARQAERDYAEFFEHGTVGLHCVGSDGTILIANQAELDLLGYSREEYVGRHIAEFHADEEKIADILTRLQAGDTLRNYEAPLRCKDGSIKHVSISSNAKWEDGQFVHSRCFTHDISSRVRAEAELREANIRKDEFLAMLGHELRNPLSPIVHAVEYLRQAGPVDEGLDRSRDIIDRQVAHMARLIDDLLNVARITRGRLDVVQEQIRLADVIQSALESARPLMDAKQHEFTLELPPDAPDFRGDPVRLSQVFSNLLGNAAKYTEPGGHVSLAVERESPETVEDAFVVSITDDGIGMPREEISSIFSMFVQLGSPPDKSREGLGVGLTLVRKIVELHGGTVEAHSAGLGSGSTFVVRLPITPGADPLPPQYVLPRQESARVVRRVLVIDDHMDAAASLSHLLRLEGHDVRSATTAEAGLAEAEAFDPEVVLLDIGLPDFDGYEACRRLRARPCGKTALIVATTGWGQARDRQTAQDAGFDHHMTKPIDLDTLRALLVPPS